MRRIGGVFSGPCTSPEAFGGLEQLQVFLRGPLGRARTFPEPQIFRLVGTQNPATIEVPVRRCQIFTGCGGGTPEVAAPRTTATFADEAYGFPK